jgi:hypothetical protein
LARKLTTEERKAKQTKKLFDGEVIATKVEVFRITKLTDGRHLYKIDTNAKQLHLTGACITTDTGVNIVIAEGGPKGIRKFNHLLLSRIDWNPTQGVRTACLCCFLAWPIAACGHLHCLCMCTIRSHRLALAWNC